VLELQLHRTLGSVTRRIPRSQAMVDLVMATGSLRTGTLLPVGGRACLEVVEPFAPLPTKLQTWGWRARMRLHWARPTVVPQPLVAVELSPWDATTIELLLVPVIPQSLHWGERRWNRYFDLAHASADALSEHITSAQNWNVF
jgi:hypothetical protein